MKDTKQSLRQRFQQLSRLQKVAISAGVAFLIYSLAGFLIIPPIVRITLEKQLTTHLHRNVKVEKVRLNPLTLSASIEGVIILKKETADTFFGFDKLSINLQAVSLFKRALIVKSVSLSKPVISFSRLSENTFSFSDLIPQSEESPPPTDKTSPLSFSIHNIEIKDGEIKVADQPKNAKHHITDLNLALASISNLPYDIEHFIQPSFSAVINGTPFSLGGNAKPFAVSKETDIAIDITDLNIAEYLAYLPNPTQAVLSSCLLDIKGNLAYSLTQTESTSAMLSYRGQLILKDILITDSNDEKFIYFPKISITTADSNLLAQHVKIANLEVSSPEFTIRRTSDQKILPLEFLLPLAQDEKAVPEPDETKSGQTAEKHPFQLDIDNLLIDKAHIAFQDTYTENFQTTLSPLSFQLKKFSTKEGEEAQFELSVQTELSEKITSTGSFQLAPTLLTNGNLSVGNISLAKYMPYARAFITPEIKDGLLDIVTDFSFEKSNNGEMNATLSESSLSLNKLNITDKGKTIISLPELKVSKGKANLEKQAIHIGEISSKNAVVTAIKDAQGALNLASMVKQPAAPQSAFPTTPKSTDTPKPWNFSIDAIGLEGYQAVLVDDSLDVPTKLHAKMDLKISELSTTGPPAHLDFSSTINEAGTIKATGTLNLTQPAATIKATIDSLAFKPFQSYVSEHLNLLLTDGSLSAQGEVSVTVEADKPAAINFSGNASIDNFATLDSLFKEELIHWNTLTLKDISFGSSPLSLNLKNIHWKAPFAKILISDTGKLNLLEIQKKPSEQENTVIDAEAEASEPQANQSSSLTITIDKFSLDGGQFDFVDSKIKPAYSASIADFSGEITGLSSSPEAKADVLLQGKLNQFSPLKVSGTINPLAEKLFADLKIDFHDIDLSPTSPYTSKHLGYKTDKGKLTLNLHYLVDDKRIDAQNHAFLDQFTLGEASNSPDAPNLPIHLALALLKNRKGEINLDIPVQGNLDDPEFSIGGVIAKVIFNLITKAVTSPFALLGALIPDSDDLQFIPFEAGKADIPAQHFDKLSQIASVLYERPGLRMDIIGRVDPVKDRAAMNESAFQKMLKFQKAEDQQGIFSNEELPSLDEITISKEEYPRYLVMAHKAMLDKKDTRSKGAKAWSHFADFIKGDSPEKDLSPEQMKEEILADINVSDESLRLLANERAANVKNYLTDSGKIEAERLFLIEPQISSVAEENSSQASSDENTMQVDLVIK